MIKKINITVYFLCTCLFSAFLCSRFLHDVPNDTLRDHIHTLLVLATYAVMYQAPAMVIYWLLRRWGRLALGLAIIFSVTAHLFLLIDRVLYDLYAFHINGFVWNLVTTPGGIQSLGADQTSILTVLTYFSALAAIQIGALFISVQLSRIHLPFWRLIFLFLVLTGTERGLYGYSEAELYGPVLARGDAMPLYQPLTMRSLLTSLGKDIKKSSKIKFDQSKSQIQYPKKPIVLASIDTPPNIVVLVSESMRWDLLNSKIMPEMTKFASKAWKFTKHYSGGNGTRQGLFSLFYGIHGNYWDLFLRNKKGPVFFDILNEYHYQYFIYTSATFTYPELDQTIFRAIPPERLIENNKGEPWLRDQLNTTSLVNDIKNRDQSKPFFGFIFYEATHARYSFDENNAVRQDYLKSLDYAGLSREELAPQAPGMKARYENSAHEIDIQAQRVVAFLEKSGELENTIFIFTGDHGEEFMERGRWGHNSAFTDWQVRVPMVVRMPHSDPKVIMERTSHMDVVPTLLSRMGVQNPVKDYSLGVDLSSPEEHRNVVVASWSDIGLINDFGKLVIPFKSTTQHQNLATDLQDNPIDGSQLAAQMKAIVFQALADARYYSR